VNVAREVIERLVRLGIDYYVTGSEALAIYAEPRQTQDTDIVVDIDPERYERELRPAFQDEFLVAPLVEVSSKWLGSLVASTGYGKVDLILRKPDQWGREALARRVQIEDPRLGRTWFSAPEDLVLAKLEWSEGRSELQLRDCRALARLNSLDWTYLERHARALGLLELLASIRDA